MVILRPCSIWDTHCVQNVQKVQNVQNVLHVHALTEVACLRHSNNIFPCESFYFQAICFPICFLLWTLQTPGGREENRYIFNKLSIKGFLAVCLDVCHYILCLTSYAWIFTYFSSLMSLLKISSHLNLVHKILGWAKKNIHFPWHNSKLRKHNSINWAWESGSFEIHLCTRP